MFDPAAAPISPFAAMVIVCWITCIMLESAFLIWDSEFISRLLRPRHARRLEQANFSRMLLRHGVEPAAYLDATPAKDVRAHLPRCEDCIEKTQCENALTAEHPLEGRIGFCPNEHVIERVVRPD